MNYYKIFFKTTKGYLEITTNLQYPPHSNDVLKILHDHGYEENHLIEYKSIKVGESSFELEPKPQIADFLTIEQAFKEKACNPAPDPNKFETFQKKYEKEFQELLEIDEYTKALVQEQQESYNIQEKQSQIKNFLKQLKEADETMIHIFTKGSCYKLCKILKAVYPNAKALYSRQDGGHWITEIDGKYYDIGGEISEDFVIDKAYEDLPECEASADIPTYTSDIGVIYGKYK